MKKIISKVAALAAAFLLCACPCAYSITISEYFAIAQEQTHINAFAATCQSAVETGYWTSELWQKSYNGAGIKADAAWRKTRGFVSIASKESNGKQYYYKLSYFRAYASPEDFLRDYECKIIQNYPHSFSQSDNFWGYYAGLYKGRYGAWATDHKYYEKLVKMSIKLAPLLLGPNWRFRLEHAYILALARNTLELWQRTLIEKYLLEVKE